MTSQFHCNPPEQWDLATSRQSFRTTSWQSSHTAQQAGMSRRWFSQWCKGPARGWMNSPPALQRNAVMRPLQWCHHLCQDAKDQLHGQLDEPMDHNAPLVWPKAESRCPKWCPDQGLRESTSDFHKACFAKLLANVMRKSLCTPKWASGAPKWSHSIPKMMATKCWKLYRVMSNVSHETK